MVGTGLHVTGRRVGRGNQGGAQVRAFGIGIRRRIRKTIVFVDLEA